MTQVEFNSFKKEFPFLSNLDLSPSGTHIRVRKVDENLLHRINDKSNTFFIVLQDNSSLAIEESVLETISNTSRFSGYVWQKTAGNEEKILVTIYKHNSRVVSRELRNLEKIEFE